MFVNYAHRGASAIAPENTMSAFKEALQQGADAIECDVQLTKDGIPVIIHDEYLDRTTNGTGLVHDWKYHDLKRLDAGSWFHEKYTNEGVPSLQQLLRWIKDTPLGLNIELKTNLIEQQRMEEKIIDLLKQYQLLDRTVLSSYDMKSLHRIHTLEPRLQTALLYFYLNEPWKYAKAIHATSLHAFYPLLTQEIIYQTKQNGIALVPYTVNDWTELSRVMRLDVAGVITKYPNRVRRYRTYTK